MLIPGRTRQLVSEAIYSNMFLAGEYRVRDQRAMLNLAHYWVSEAWRRITKPTTQLFDVMEAVALTVLVFR